MAEKGSRTQEGIIKYQLNFTSEPPLNAADLEEINRWRAILYEQKLIGQDPARVVHPCASRPTAAHLRRGAMRRQKANSQGASMAATRIDCDIHPAVGGTRTTLLPYLSDHWKEQVTSRCLRGSRYQPAAKFSRSHQR